jgi:type I restriction enzyme M protein
LTSCNLHTILDCPSGTFIGAGVKTVVLFFEKGEPFDSVSFGSAQGTGMPLFAQGKSVTEGMATRKIWYYQLDPGRNMGKTNSLNDQDLREFVEFQAGLVVSEKSWLVDVADVDRESFDLSVKNPNKAEEAALREPLEIIDEIAALDAESAEILAGIGGML